MKNRGQMLLAYLREVRAGWRGFIPGEVDCAHFVAEWVRRVRGEDLARAWSGTYRTLDEGKAALQARGFADLGELAAARLDVIAPDQRALGDVAAIREAGELALGIVTGPQIHVLSLHGLGAVSGARAERVFRP